MFCLHAPPVTLSTNEMFEIWPKIFRSESGKILQAKEKVTNIQSANDCPRNVELCSLEKAQRLLLSLVPVCLLLGPWVFRPMAWMGWRFFLLDVPFVPSTRARENCGSG